MNRLKNKSDELDNKLVEFIELYYVIIWIQFRREMNPQINQTFSDDNSPKQLLISNKNGVFITEAFNQQLLQPDRVFSKVNYIIQLKKSSLLIVASQIKVVLYSLKQRNPIIQLQFQCVHSISLSPSQNYLQVLDKKPQFQGTTYLYILPNMQLSITYTDQLTEYFNKYYFPLIKFTSDDSIYFRYNREIIEQIIVQKAEQKTKQNKIELELQSQIICKKSQQKYQNSIYQKYQGKPSNKGKQNEQENNLSHIAQNDNQDDIQGNNYNYQQNQNDKKQSKDQFSLIKKNVNKKQTIKIYNCCHQYLTQIQCDDLQFFQISKISNKNKYLLVAIFYAKKNNSKECRIYSSQHINNQPIFTKQLKQLTKTDEINIKFNPMSNIFLMQQWSYIDLSQKLDNGSFKLQLYNDKTNKMNSIKIQNGPIHDFSWHKKGQVFITITGQMPTTVRMYNKQKMLIFEFGKMLQNTIIWGNLGRFVCFANINNPNGQLSIWDLQAKQQIGYSKCGMISSCQWSLDDRKILTSLINPQCKQNNCYKIYSIKGTQLSKINYRQPQLYSISWLHFYDQNFIMQRREKQKIIKLEIQARNQRERQQENKKQRQNNITISQNTNPIISQLRSNRQKKQNTQSNIQIIQQNDDVIQDSLKCS